MKYINAQLPPDMLSTLDDKTEGEDMRYLIQPRGPGKSWVFRMKTPPELIGKSNPITGRKFAREIRLGLSTRRLSEARSERDILLGKIREAQAALLDDSRFSVNMGVAWAEEIKKEEAEGFEPDEATVDVRSILYDGVEAAERSRKVPPLKLTQFLRVAKRRTKSTTTASLRRSWRKRRSRSGNGCERPDILRAFEILCQRPRKKTH
jgi:hypothetical protein